MKNITFLLPSHGRRPTGGYKVVYEYANRLSANGYTVNIVYPATIFFLKQSFRKKIKCIIKKQSALLNFENSSIIIGQDDKSNSC